MSNRWRWIIAAVAMAALWLLIFALLYFNRRH